MIKKILFAVFLLAIFCFGLNLVQADYSASSVTGRIIALDAGHGGDDPGAINKNYEVTEKDVNLAVVKALQTQLTEAGARVVLTREGDETILSRKKRVEIAKNKCAELDINGDGQADGSECDILVSVHHNGSSDPARDGTMAIYNHKADFVLAEALHDALIAKFELADEGYDHGGYGMTVYFTPAAITEAYYITNDWEAEQHYYSIDKDENDIVDQIEQEADALHEGLVNYFESSRGGGKPENPGKGNKK